MLDDQDLEEVYCVCGCGIKRPRHKMYTYRDSKTDELVYPVIKGHMLRKHLEQKDA